MKEYNGVFGFKAIVDDETIDIKSTVIKGKFYLTQLEYVELGKVNWQNRGTMNIYAETIGKAGLVFKGNQEEQFKELFDYLKPFMQRIIFDNKNNVLKVLNKGRDIDEECTLIDYNDINSYELISDKQTINNNMLVNTAAGEYVGGDIGFLIGALTSTGNGTYSDNMYIKLNIKNDKTPCIKVNYILNKTKLDSVYGKDIIKMCENDLARLEDICKNKQINQKTEKEDLNPLKKIKELKELLDIGAITQEEFDKKKADLLDRI